MTADEFVFSCSIKMAPCQQNEFAKWTLRPPASYAHGSEAPGTDLPRLDSLERSPIKPGVGSSAVRGRGRDRARFVVGIGIGLGLGLGLRDQVASVVAYSERSRVVVGVGLVVGVGEPCIASSERGPPGLGLGRVLVFFVEPCIASTVALQGRGRGRGRSRGRSSRPSR